MKLNPQACLEGKHKDILDIACAELEGQKYHKPTEAEIKSGSYYQYEPNYTDPTAGTALENVHRLEELLTETQRFAWAWKLVEIAGEHVLSATALQRVTALLLTLKPEMFEI